MSASFLMPAEQGGKEDRLQVLKITVICIL